MKTKLTWFDRIMAAVTFAEADERAEGLVYLVDSDDSRKPKAAEKGCNDIPLADLHSAEVHL